MYFDYKNLHKSEKRDTFLKILIKLTNYKEEFVKYSELSFLDKDLSDFINLIETSNYNKYFICYEEGLK